MSNEILHDSKQLAINVLKAAVKYLEGEDYVESPMKGLEGFDCDAMSIAHKAIDKVV